MLPATHPLSHTGHCPLHSAHRTFLAWSLGVSGTCYYASLRIEHPAPYSEVCLGVSSLRIVDLGLHSQVGRVCTIRWNFNHAWECASECTSQWLRGVLQSIVRGVHGSLVRGVLQRILEGILRTLHRCVFGSRPSGVLGSILGGTLGSILGGVLDCVFEAYLGGYSQAGCEHVIKCNWECAWKCAQNMMLERVFGALEHTVKQVVGV